MWYMILGSVHWNFPNQIWGVCPLFLQNILGFGVILFS